MFIFSSFIYLFFIYRVCHRWRRILKENQTLWLSMDFFNHWTPAPSPSPRRKRFTWRDECILDILRRYSSPCLNTVSLELINSFDTVKFLQKHSPNLERLSVSFDVHWKSKLIKETNTILQVISKCTNLKYLHLNKVKLSTPGMGALASNTSLTELVLGESTSVAEKGVLNDILCNTVENRLSTFCLDYSQYHGFRPSGYGHEDLQEISAFLNSRKNWTNLKTLKLSGELWITCAETVFTNLTPAVPNLVNLTVSGEWVTEELLDIITRHFQQLIEVEVSGLFVGNSGYHERRTISLSMLHNFGRCLRLKKLNIGFFLWYQGYLTQLRHSDVLYELICSLPEVRYLRVNDEVAESDVREVLEHCKNGNQFQINGATETDVFGSAVVFNISREVETLEGGTHM